MFPCICIPKTHNVNIQWGFFLNVRPFGQTLQWREQLTAVTSARHPSIHRRNRSASEWPSVHLPQQKVMENVCVRISWQGLLWFGLLSLCPLIKGHRWEQLCGSSLLMFPFQLRECTSKTLAYRVQIHTHTYHKICIYIFIYLSTKSRTTPLSVRLQDYRYFFFWEGIGEERWTDLMRSDKLSLILKPYLSSIYGPSLF